MTEILRKKKGSETIWERVTTRKERQINEKGEDVTVDVIANIRETSVKGERDSIEFSKKSIAESEARLKIMEA